MVVVGGGPTTSTTATQPPNTGMGYRQCLLVSTAALLTETGFDLATKSALETLAELIQSFIVELGRSSRAFTELACRTEPLGADVLLALTEMGYPAGYNLVLGLKEYALRTNRKSVGNPQVASMPKPPAMLHTGDRKKKATAGLTGGGVHVVPDHFPEFPDSHSYIRTPTHKQPSHDEYASVREKAASQKRDVERALTRFIAKTCGKTHSLFNTNDTNLFPLISCDQTARLTASMAGPIGPDGPHPDSSADLGSYTIPAYINALVFRDQIFEEDERDFLPRKRRNEDEEEMDNEIQLEKKKKQKKKHKKKKKDDEEKESESDDNAAEEDQAEIDRKLEEARREEQKRKEEERRERERNAAKEIDNPFLKPVRMPRCGLGGLTSLMATPMKKEK